MFLDDSQIIQVNDNNGRHYYHTDTPNMKYPSVSKLCEYYDHKGYERILAWKAKLVETLGAEEAEKQSHAGANRGTRIHNALETGDFSKLDKKEVVRFKNLQKLVNKINVLGLEKRVMWTDKNDPKVGFFGTLDCISTVDLSTFLDSEDKPIGQGEAYTIFDWKNVTKFYDLDFYLKYYLQAAAYATCVNKMTDCKYKINKCFIAFTTAKMLKVVYLEPRIIMYFSNAIKQMAKAYAYQEDYDYESFRSHTIGYLTEEGVIQDYLPKQVYLSKT